MAPLTESKDPIELPDTSSWSVQEFITDLVAHPDTPVVKLLESYKGFEAQLRKAYAQQPTHEALKDGKINLIPVFDDGTEQHLKIRARPLASESHDDKAKYIMELKDKDRKPDGAPAVVSSFKDFQQNFNLFSESSLSDLDWNNVVAAGSSVTTALLPVPEKWAGSKRSLREYYHEHLAPASDVDLFIYGLNEEQGLEKIRQIERNIKDSILHETTTIRTKNAITIASQYPTRHVQIVLRLYDSISQIITGFDVDCACIAYNGSQVYAAPRAIAAFITQCNTIDLTRRSPSYENRLSKYSRRGFEVHWPLLDRTRIDPTIFERSFGRTQGLARLLILEKLPKTVDRDNYMDQRRAERGRPTLHRNFYHKMGGNIKDQEEDDIAEWVDHEEVASYHTMTVPYGPKYHAAKINRLLYAKDLLLNAEWNKPDDREVHLHRHPCFFGTAEEVLQDCCGYCPVPKCDEEIEVAEEESKVYISGPLKFIIDDPGRQEIGSFNPITDDEWTTMAYVGDTARLCQAIVDGDLEHVEDWCSQEGVDVNRRDYTGRTPLHLAVMTSTPEIVQCLIDYGARLIARLVDGRTALHLAAARGSREMVKALMDKSLANEEEEEEKVEAKRAARKAEKVTNNGKVDDEMSDVESEASEITLDSEESDSMTMGSFVKVDKQANQEDGVPEDSTEEPDIYEVDVIAWDYGLSPLHLAILNGHLEIIELLVSEYGADVLLPVKLVEPGAKNAKGAIMTILLAMALPTEKAKAVITLLLELGATSAQADMNHTSALHFVVAEDNHSILDLLLANDRPVALSVLNWMSKDRWGNEGDSPVTTAIKMGHRDMVAKLLSIGAKPEISFDSWVKVYLEKNTWAKTQSPEDIKRQFHTSVIQPVISAAGNEMGKVVEDLIAHGADPSTLERSAYGVIQNPENARYTFAESLLDVIQKKLKTLREWEEPSDENSNRMRPYYYFSRPTNLRPKKPETLRDEASYIDGFEKGTYTYWSAQQDFKSTKHSNDNEWKAYNEWTPSEAEDGLVEKKAAISKLITELEHAEKTLVEAGAKTFAQLCPDIPRREEPKQQVYPDPKPTFYETTLRFRVPDLNDTKKEGYIKMFEAVWNNDLETIKSLTLGKWSSEDGMPLNSPLKIAVQDGNGFSPFSIAVLRGHRELARKIVEICATQYHKEDGLSTKQRFRTISGSDEDDDADSDDGNMNGLPIFSELVNDKFTVDNLGDISNIVKSDVLPLTMIEWSCKAQRFLDSDRSKRSSEVALLQHAVKEDNMDLFKFMIELGGEQKALLAEEDDDQKCYTVNSALFYTAIRLGRTAMLAEMIKATGVGIPLNELIAKSGVELKTKPRYYQGLSVGGKKRADWAQAPGDYQRVVEEKTPPLLQAAKLGSIDTVEWFMSDAPMRRYKEFAETNKHDKRIKTLEEGKGFDKTIGTWLNAKSELTLHCAILYNPDKEQNHPEYLALIKHLVSVVPESLEQKSSEGWTPLQLAANMHREDVVAYLISAGANQRSRDKAGRNMAHSIIVQQGYRTSWTDAEALKQLIELFDKAALKEMLLERCTQSPGALTPLAYYMARKDGSYKKADIIEVLTSYSSGEELEMINGEGDLPLHVAVKQALTTITTFLLSLNPSLLHRENSTGRTPLEMSREIYIASQVESPPNIMNGNHFSQYHPGQQDYNSVVNRAASSFAMKAEDEENKKRTWEVCQGKDEEIVKEGGERKRRLVSLFEANEVARRVAGLKRGFGGGQMVVNGGFVEEGKPDVVTVKTTSQEIVALASAVSSAAASAAASTAASTALPSGITAPLEQISSTNVGGLVAILSAFALSLVLISFPIRVYVRSKFSAYKSDDFAFVFATVFAILQASGVFYQLDRGLGKSIDLIEPDNLIEIQKAAYSSDILYIITLSLTKLSTAFLFLRLTPGRGHSIAIWSTISLTLVWTLISILLIAIRCHGSHPWLDTTTAMCGNLFARWQFIAGLDILSEAALFSISLYLIWGIQMSIKSKTIVVTSFGCRLPVIALAGLRLYYLHMALSTSNPTLHGTPESTSVTQIEIGYAILASIVPCLKNFMAAYDAPIQSMHWYPTPSNTGYTHELASVASKAKSAMASKSTKSLSVSISQSASRESPETVEREKGEVYKGGRKGGGASILSSSLGRLRPEQISYEARVEFKEREGERSSREEEGVVGRRSVESINSRRMIIKKGVEWSVDYDRRSREDEGV